MSGKIDLTVNESIAALKQVLDADLQLTPEQRYAIHAGMESLSFVKLLSPGLHRALQEHKPKKAPPRKAPKK